MKKIVAISLVLVIGLTSCSKTISIEEIQPIETTTSIQTEMIVETEQTQISVESSEPAGLSKSDGTIVSDNTAEINDAIIEEDITYNSLNDPNLQSNLKDAVYDEIISELDSDKYVVQSIDTCYISKEYIEELTYNSQENVFFGYNLNDVNSYFNGEKYTFTLGTNNETVVEAFESYDEAYEKMLKNVAIGTGVIIVVVVIAVVTDGVGAPPAVCAIAAFSAKGAISLGLSSAAMGGITSAATSLVKGEDQDSIMKNAALGASEGYKTGAIIGAVSGALFKAGALAYGTSSGLTMNEVATIQQESKFPLSVIKQLKSMDEYEIIKSAGLYSKKVNGATALIRDIDLDYVDPKSGLTNLERMLKGEAALDPLTGEAYQLHHVGQKSDSVLAILTKAEHKGEGNFSILHDLTKSSEVSHGPEWTKQKADFWKAVGKLLSGM